MTSAWRALRTRGLAPRARVRVALVAAAVAVAAIVTVAAQVRPERGSALGPVIAVTPNETAPTSGYVLNPSLSQRGQAAGLNDGEISTNGFVSLDAAGVDPTTDGFGSVVSGNGCRALQVRRAPIATAAVDEAIIVDRCNPFQQTVIGSVGGNWYSGLQMALNFDGLLGALPVGTQSGTQIARVNTNNPADIAFMPVTPGFTPTTEYGIDISDNGSVIVTAIRPFEGSEVTVAVWNLATGAVTLPFGSGGGWTAFPSLSGDGRYLSAATSIPRTGGEAGIGPWVYVLDLATGAVRLVSGAADGAFHSSLSQDGSQIAYVVGNTPGMPQGCKYNQGSLDDIQYDCGPVRVDVAFGPAPGFAAGFAVETITGPGTLETGTYPQPVLSGNGRWVAWLSTQNAALGYPASFGQNMYMRRRDPGIAIDPVDFGAVPVGTFVDRMTTVRNTGRTTVSTDAFGASPGSFVRIPGGSCVDHGTLPPGATCTITLRFTAGAPGTFDGSVSVAEQGYDAIGASAPMRAFVPTPPTVPDTTAPPVIVTTTAPTVTTIPGVVTLTAAPDPVDFGPVRVGFPSEEIGIEVTNTGTGSGVIGTELLGAHPDDFFVKTNDCVGLNIVAGQTCAIGVILIARDGGNRTATIRVSAGGSVVDVELLGQGRFEPRLAASPQAVTTRGVVTIIGQGFPPGETVTVSINDTSDTPTGVTMSGTPDATGLFRIPFVPLGKLELGPYLLHADGVANVYGPVEASLVVVLPTFQPQGPGGPAFNQSLIVTRGG